MHTHNSPRATDARERRPDPAETASACAQAVREIAAIVAESLAILASVPYAPRNLRREGQRLDETTRRAPANQPPRNLWQAVRSWVRTIVKWVRDQRPGRSRPATDTDRRLTRLERRVDALAVAMREGFAQARREREAGFAQARQEREAGFAQARQERREMNHTLHQRMDDLQDMVQTSFADIRKDLSLHAKANEHIRAHIIESALMHWSLDARTWSRLLSLAPERIATELLWEDHYPPRVWTTIADQLGLPHDSRLQRCDHLALITLQWPAAEPIRFLVVGEASVQMDGRRLDKVLRHVQDLQAHTDYPVLPCLYTHHYADDLCMRALRAGVIVLEWQRGDRTYNHGGDEDLAARIRAMSPR